MPQHLTVLALHWFPLIFHSLPFNHLFVIDEFNIIRKSTIYRHLNQKSSILHCTLLLVTLSVLMGMPRKLPSLLKLSMPQYFSSKSGNCTQIGNVWRDEISNCISSFQALTMKGFLSKKYSPLRSTSCWSS